jgi:hypothetical protein
MNKRIKKKLSKRYNLKSYHRYMIARTIFITCKDELSAHVNRHRSLAKSFEHFVRNPNLNEIQCAVFFSKFYI